MFRVRKTKMKIGNQIDKLIATHIELWHTTSPARLYPNLTSEERVALFMKTRALNVLRAQIRDAINLVFDSGWPDPKINYTGEE